MKPEDIKVGQHLAGKGADADKVWIVDGIKGDQAAVAIYRDGQLLGKQTFALRIVAQWAAADVTPDSVWICPRCADGGEHLEHGPRCPLKGGRA